MREFANYCLANPGGLAKSPSIAKVDVAALLQLVKESKHLLEAIKCLAIGTRSGDSPPLVLAYLFTVQTHQQFVDSNGIATLRFLLEAERPDETDAEIICTHGIRVLSNLCQTRISIFGMNIHTL